MSWFIEVLTEMGLEGNYQRRNQEWAALCPFHEESNPSFYVNSESGAWICHAGCGSGGFMLLMDRLQSGKARPVQRRQQRNGATAAASLREFDARGLNPAIMARWGIRWDGDVGAIEIPVYDHENNFIGRIWRMPKDAVPKYRHPDGFPRNRLLFGSWRLPEGKEVILAEGPLDAIWLQEAGLPGVALFGAYLSMEQMHLLRVLDRKRVSLCFDNDKAGATATEAVTKQLREQGFWVYRITVPSRYKDIQDVPLSEVPAVVGNKNLCINGAGVVGHQYRRWLAAPAPTDETTSSWRY